MESKKKEIYEILKSVEVEGLDIVVYQERPEVVAKTPCITFRVEDNAPEYTLLKEIYLQKVKVVVDLWGSNSVETGKMLEEVEKKMRANDYLLTFSADVLDDTGKSHITTQFIF